MIPSIQERSKKNYYIGVDFAVSTKDHTVSIVGEVDENEFLFHWCDWRYPCPICEQNKNNCGEKKK